MKSYPGNLKFKKYHRVNKSFLTLLDQKRFFPLFGQYGLQAIESGKLTFKQIEACRRTIRRGIGKSEFFSIRLFTYAPVTKKSIASRMGKGKGNLSHWMAPIKYGQMLFEINCITLKKAIDILNKAATKLPIKTKVKILSY